MTSPADDAALTGANGQPVQIINGVEVDAEIAPIVAALNAYGVATVASCSGHGHRPANIALSDGREIVIARDHAEARRIDALFATDINGCTADDAALIERLRGCMLFNRDKTVSPLPYDAAARITALNAELSERIEEGERLREALEPFARIADKGKHGGRFVIASATYSLANGKLDATPRESHWHWDDFERARAALSTPSRGER